MFAISSPDEFLVYISIDMFLLVGDAVSDRNVLVYQSLDNGSVYAIDVDRNATHLVVDSNVIVRLHCIVCQFSNDTSCLKNVITCARLALFVTACCIAAQLAGHCVMRVC